MTVFAYLDIENPIVAWGVYRGVLVSAKADGDLSHPCTVSMMFASMVRNRNGVQLQNELILEEFRQAQFPQCVSRLAGMYFFEGLDAAKSAASWGEHFTKECLSEIELFPTVGASRHDANWISYAPRDRDHRYTETCWFKNYWAGDPYPLALPVWEIVANGRGVVMTTAVRFRARETITSRWPDVLGLMEYSRVAAYMGFDFGQTVAWLGNTTEGSVRLEYMFDNRDQTNPEFAKAVQNFTGHVNQADLAVGGEYFVLPDFRSYGCEFEMGTSLTDALIHGVHHNAAKQTAS